MSQDELAGTEPSKNDNTELTWAKLEMILKRGISMPDPRYADPKFFQPPKKPYIRRDNVVGKIVSIHHSSNSTIVEVHQIPPGELPITFDCLVYKIQAEPVGDKLISIHECHLHQVIVTWLK